MLRSSCSYITDGREYELPFDCSTRPQNAGRSCNFFPEEIEVSSILESFPGVIFSEYLILAGSLLPSAGNLIGLENRANWLVESI